MSINGDSNFSDVDRLIDELLCGDGCDEEENSNRKQEEIRRAWSEGLDRALAANCRLRDQNFLHGDHLLVFDEESGGLDEVAVWNLPLWYPINERWVDSDFGKVLRLKFAGYRQSVVAHALARENSDANPQCSAVVLVIPKDSDSAYSFVEIKAYACARS
jgi:hypothetical protein